MTFTFQSVKEHNLLSIIKRHLVKIIWPLAVPVLLSALFPNSAIVKNNLHWYVLAAIEIYSLFSAVTDYSINRIVVNTVSKK